MKNLPSEEFLQEIRPKCVEENWENDEIYANTLMFYLFANQFVSDKEVLDAACGYGYGAYLFAQTAKRVIAVDLDDRCINYAVENYMYDNLDYYQMDVTNLTLEDNRFNVVISIETMEHLPPESTDSYLYELKRVLKPGGLLVLTTPNRNATTRRKKPMTGHINERTAAELRALINASFVEPRFYYFLRVPQYGGEIQSFSNDSVRGQQGLRLLRRMMLRTLGLVKQKLFDKKHQSGLVVPLLETKHIFEMQTPDDEKCGLFQIVVARKDS